MTFFGPNSKNIFESTINKEFERCIYENCVYSSIKYTRSKKFNDSVIHLKNEKFVQILQISLQPNNTCSLIVKQLIIKPFLAGPTTISHIWEVTQNITHAPVSLAEINSKAVVLDLKERQYVCEIPNTIEAQ